MSTIHMDVHSVREARRHVQQISANLSNLLSQVDNSVNRVVGIDWVAESGHEFNLRYSDIRRQLLDEIHHLDDLARKLDREIDRWEEMARHLGGH